MDVLSLITALVIIVGVVTKGGYERSLAIAGATAAGVAIVAGDGIAVPTFYAVAIGAAIALALAHLRRAGAPAPGLPPGTLLLTLLLGWATLVTFVSPFIFNGTIVHAPCPRCALEIQGGFLTSSNIAQIIYLVLSVGVVIFIARSPSAGPGLIGISAGLATALSLWRYGYVEFGLPFPEGVFDNSPNFAYIETAAGNVQRFRGILSEPSGLAVQSLVTLGYMLPRACQVRGARRVGALALAAGALYLGLISTSTTFVVAGLVIVGIAAAVHTVSFLSRRSRVPAAAAVAACMLVVAGLWLVPVIIDFAQLAINQKLGTSSYDDRSAVNESSYEVFLKTFGVGVGLGANRASAFIPGILSTIGLVGALLYATLLVKLIWQSRLDRSYRPVAWTLVSLVVTKIISAPDLSDSGGISWLCIGLLSGAVLRMQAQRRAAPALDVPVLPGPAVTARATAGHP